jgi:hypothetical protein
MRSQSARQISTLVGVHSPRNSRSRLVLPLPFGHTNPTRKPAEIMKLSRSKSLRSATSQVTFCSSISR